MSAGRTVKERPVGFERRRRGRGVAARRVRGGGVFGLDPAAYRAYSVIVPSGLIIIASGTSSASPNDVELRIE